MTAPEDDPVSAQAAPDFPLTVPKGYTPEQVVTRIEQAAVRAALEGLRAEVAHRYTPDSRDVWNKALDEAIAAIDARLADLP